ncbi:MAG: Rrf2 family transcriptional regulator [Candidatus Marinimicrobia bacterium]|nr:Rrf2 family transcriptional regulator [Candidatus Neomarinimicrobiota bacterium]MBL7059895.1 Rrf2 family transcriptional regulator [Candidatus Neomarinimicrobiota bacterium]
MLYSKSAEYAIQAMIYLAEKNSPKPTMVSEIAEAYAIPQQFLAKIAQILSKHQLLIAIRGRNGGVRLGRPANEIFLDQIVYVVDGPQQPEARCVIGLDKCSDEAPCPLHHKWKVIREDIRDMLVAENLETLAKRVIDKRKLMKEVGLAALVSD